MQGARQLARLAVHHRCGVKEKRKKRAKEGKGGKEKQTTKIVSEQTRSINLPCAAGQGGRWVRMGPKKGSLLWGGDSPKSQQKPRYRHRNKKDKKIKKKKKDRERLSGTKPSDVILKSHPSFVMKRRSRKAVQTWGKSQDG